MAAAAPGGSGAMQQFASLYVGDVNQDVTEAILYEIFNAVGPVASIRVCRDSVTRKSLGYAYVNYHNVSDAERALDTLNYSQIKGRACRIMWSHRDPAMRKAGSGNIFVKNLDTNIDNKALYDTFSLFGNILSCKVAADENGKSKGYGFVHYQEPEDAAKAISSLNGLQVANKRIKVSYSRPNTADIKDTNLYVGNVPQGVSEADLERLFGQHGSLLTKKLLRDQGGKNKGIAFVRFSKKSESEAAIAHLHGHFFPGATRGLEVKVAEDHGRQKAAFYAGWMQGQGGGEEIGRAHV